MTTESNRASKKKYRDAHKEERAAYAKKYYADHREQRRLYLAHNKDTISDRAKVYNEANRERISSLKKEYQIAHAEEHRAAGRKYVKNNLDVVLVNTRNYKARKKSASGNGWSVEEERQLKEDYCFRCAYCGRKKKLTMDHVVPIARGGNHSVDNVVPACGNCNSSKRDKPLLLWMYQRNDNCQG